VENDEANEDGHNWEWLLWLVILIPLVVVGWLWGGWWLPATYGGTGSEQGIFGDRFGAINALFSGLAFAGLIVAIVLQRRELELQRRELRETRAEFRQQRQQMEAQTLSLRRQTFENTFFQLLRAHNDIVNAIDLRDYRAGAIVKTVGRDCFRIFYARLKKAHAELAVEGGRGLAELIAAAYDEFFRKHQADVGHYFSQLHDILDFVHASEGIAKPFYAGLVRGQLSTFELGLLFYHCLTARGAGLKARVEEFGLLRELSEEILIQPQHRELYPAAAFDAAAQ
jgi:hypothetical protein